MPVDNYRVVVVGVPKVHGEFEVVLRSKAEAQKLAERLEREMRELGRMTDELKRDIAKFGTGGGLR